jgi:hypothetical protein
LRIKEEEMILSKRVPLLIACLLTLVLAVSCATTGPGPAGTIKAPVVALENVELAHYWGFWYFGKKVAPTKGKPTDAGAPMDLAFVFNVTNPNPFPVKLEDLKFSVAFEDFELNTVTAYETMWIPPNKTNQYRVHAMFDVFTSFLSLGVTGGFQLKARNVAPWDQLEKWWDGVQTFSFPISVNNGTATFKADDKSVISSFRAVYPAPAAKK